MNFGDSIDSLKSGDFGRIGYVWYVYPGNVQKYVGESPCSNDPSNSHAEHCPKTMMFWHSVQGPGMPMQLVICLCNCPCHVDEIEKVLDFADAKAIPAVGVDVARILLNRIKELEKGNENWRRRYNTSMSSQHLENLEVRINELEKALKLAAEKECSCGITSRDEVHCFSCEARRCFTEDSPVYGGPEYDSKRATEGR